MPSGATFGGGVSAEEEDEDEEDGQGDEKGRLLTPVFRRMQEQERRSWGQGTHVASSAFSMESGVPVSATKIWPTL